MNFIQAVKELELGRVVEYEGMFDVVQFKVVRGDLCYRIPIEGKEWIVTDTLEVDEEFRLAKDE